MINYVTLCLYRSPSQNIEEHETFVKNLGLNLEPIFSKNPYLTVVIGDFNVKSQNWYKGNKTTASGTKLEIMTSHYGLTTQIINEPALILEDVSSCIALTFTSKPNTVFDRGVHFSLHSNSHHQIVFAKFNLKVYYHPPYEKHIWHYKYAHNVQIKNALASFNWKQALSNSSIDKISIPNETIINVMSNYIPNKIKVFDDQKQHWMNAESENLITTKNDVFKRVFITKRCNHLHPAPSTSTQLHPAPSTSTQLISASN